MAAKSYAWKLKRNERIQYNKNKTLTQRQHISKISTKTKHKTAENADIVETTIHQDNVQHRKNLQQLWKREPLLKCKQKWKKSKQITGTEKLHVHEVQQNGDENWQKSDDENEKQTW